MTASRTFVDTNVLVYALDPNEPVKRQRANSVLAGIVGQVVLSTQVLGEFYVTITRELHPPVSDDRAVEMIADLSQQLVVSTDAVVVRPAIETSQRHQLSYWDALIVEAAVAGGCVRLLTEDLAAGWVIRGVEIVDPFA